MDKVRAINQHVNNGRSHYFENPQDRERFDREVGFIESQVGKVSAKQNFKPITKFQEDKWMKDLNNLI